MQFMKILSLVGLVLTFSAFAQTANKPTTGRVKMDNEQFNQQTEKCKVGAVVAPVAGKPVNNSTTNKSSNAKGQ